jgi:hypothetical protein
MDRPFRGNNLDLFMFKVVSAFAAAIALFYLSGCASISVDKQWHADASLKAPQKIYVQDFEVAPGVLRVDRGGASLEKFQKSFRNQLKLAIVERASKRMGTVVPTVDDDWPPRSAAWLITGRFVTVNQGSRALRAVVGLGAGGTKVRTEVVVYDLSSRHPQPLLRFETTGGSNAVPGAVFGLLMPNYWLLALDLAGKIGPGLKVDVIRTSREIVAVLSEYMAQEGLLSPAKISHAKKLGQWP